jgi:hypothetical protein
MYDFSQTATAIQLEKRDHQRFQACDLDIYIAPGVYSTMSIELGRSCLLDPCAALNLQLTQCMFSAAQGE